MFLGAMCSLWPLYFNSMPLSTRYSSALACPRVSVIKGTHQCFVQLIFNNFSLRTSNHHNNFSINTSICFICSPHQYTYLYSSKIKAHLSTFWARYFEMVLKLISVCYYLDFKRYNSTDFLFEVSSSFSWNE